MHSAAVISLIAGLVCGNVAVAWLALKLAGKSRFWWMPCLLLGAAIVLLGVSPTLDVLSIKARLGYIPISAGEGATLGEIVALGGLGVIGITVLVKLVLLVSARSR